ncbi:hypothetical protein AOLI_G00216770 [Acnodon oligacanthus]
MAQDWKMLVDIGQQLIFPPEIAATTFRPDLVLWSPSLKSVYITELTVPWENAIEEACERKKLRYTELAADAQQFGQNFAEQVQIQSDKLCENSQAVFEFIAL